MVKAKICGLKTQEVVDVAVAGGAAFLGFVFFEKSPRNITAEVAAELVQNIPADVKSVAVLVNPTDKELTVLLEKFKPDYLQLHGDETPERVREVFSLTNIPIIKAIKVSNADDVAAWQSFSGIAEMLLFDAKAPKGSALPGGNGLRFDWNMLANRQISLPWLLSGGLNADNVTEAVALTGTAIVDASSSLESAPGVKDPKLITDFLESCAKL